MPSDEPAGVAFDVASRVRWIGAAEQDDVRVSTWIEVPELPWPLRFDFLPIREDDGSERLGVYGFEFGAPVARDSVGGDPAIRELTAERLALIWGNFQRYRQLAENLLTIDHEAATRTRAGMRRAAGGDITDDYLALLVAEWRRVRSKRGAMYELAASRRTTRFTIRRHLVEAEARGLMQPGELPRRQRKPA